MQQNPISSFRTKTRAICPKLMLTQNAKYRKKINKSQFTPYAVSSFIAAFEFNCFYNLNCKYFIWGFAHLVSYSMCVGGRISFFPSSFFLPYHAVEKVTQSRKITGAMSNVHFSIFHCPLQNGFGNASVRITPVLNAHLFSPSMTCWRDASLLPKHCGCTMYQARE